MRQPFATIFVLACALGLLAGCQTHRAAPAPAVMPATSIELRTPRPGLYTAGQPAADDWAAINTAFRENDNPLFGIKPKEEAELLYQRILSLAPAPIGYGPAR